MNVFYGRRKEGKPWHSVILRGGGMGASASADGHYVSIFPANGANTPVEIFESDTPLIVEKRELLTDSGGAGKMKGGLGRREIFRIPDDEYAPLPPVNLGIQSGRYRYPPEGLFDGRRGAKAQFLVSGQPGNPFGLTRMRPGDEVVIDVAGGGGFGDPLDRDPEMVQEDVVQGYVSLQKAKEDFGVVINPATMKADLAATGELRRSMRASLTLGTMQAQSCKGT
jgi:N-methylhydantoinase B